MKLEDFRVAEVPSICYYIPNFVSEADESLLIHNIQKISPLRWTQLKNRRLLNLGGIPTQKGMIAEEIPSFLQTYLDKINELSVFEDCKANHILLNEYKPGQGIMSHFDGPLFYPTITTISIGSHTVLEFHEPRDFENVEDVKAPSFKLLVEPRSLLILKEEMYHRFMHSISEIESDNTCDPLIKNLNCTEYRDKTGDIPRSTRFSLTIRNVPKTSKLKLKFGK